MPRSSMRRFFNTLSSDDSQSTSSPSDSPSKNSGTLDLEAFGSDLGFISGCNRSNVLDDSSPSSFDYSLKSTFIKVDKNMVTVSYTGRGTQQHDVGSIRSNVPFSGNKLIDYFEVQIMNAGERCSIMVGLTDEKSDFVSTHHPGWDADSYGLYGSDGRIYNAGKHSKFLTTKFVEGDVIGCGINYNQKNIFFTKNGNFLGVAFHNIKSGRLYPTVGMHSKNEVVKGVFCNFMYNIEAMIEDERKIVQKSIDQIQLFEEEPKDTGRLDGNELDLMIREYLYFCGYSDTLKLFEQSASLKQIEGDSSEKRKIICKYIESGEVKLAMEMISSSYQKCLQENEDVHIRLHCQTMIEMIKQNQVMEALKYAREHISKYMTELDTNSPSNSLKKKQKKKTTDPAICKLLIDSVGLLAYADLNACPLTYLLSQEHRNELATLVNQIILLDSGEKKTQSSLETTVRQFEVVKKVLVQVGSGNLTPSETIL